MLNAKIRRDTFEVIDKLIKLEEEKDKRIAEQTKQWLETEAKQELDCIEHEERHKERMIMMFMQVLTCTGTALVHYRTMDPVVIIVIMHHIQLLARLFPDLVATMRCLKVMHMTSLCEVVN